MFRPRSIAASIVSALVIAALAHLGMLLAFFVFKGFDPAVFPVVNAFFVPQTLFVLLFSAVFAWVGAYRRWYLALVAGVVSAVLAALVGTGIPLLAQGNTLDSVVIDYLIASLAGINLVFMLVVVLSWVTVGRRVYFGIAAADRASAVLVAERRVAIIRRPPSTLADGHVTHIDESEIDLELAEEQWESYVSVLETAGWNTVEVDVADNLADSGFVEDAV